MNTLEEAIKGTGCDLLKVSELCALKEIAVSWNVEPINVRVSILKDDESNWNHIIVSINFLRDAYDAQGYLVAKINSMMQGCK